MDQFFVELFSYQTCQGFPSLGSITRQPAENNLKNYSLSGVHAADDGGLSILKLIEIRPDGNCPTTGGLQSDCNLLAARGKRFAVVNNRIRISTIQI